MQLIKIFFIGLLISFLGTLPLGTLNVLAAKLSVSAGVISACCFSLGALLVEMGYVRLSLVAMDWVRKQKRLFELLEWLTVGIVFVLALGSFWTAYQGAGNGALIKGQGFQSGPLFCFLGGILLSAVNPLQIPFWFGWSTILLTKKILLPRADQYNAYIAGIGLGTFAGDGVFIFGGHYFVNNLFKYQNILNWVIGGVFLVTALLQGDRILSRKKASRKL